MVAQEIDMPVWVLRGSSFMSAPSAPLISEYTIAPISSSSRLMAATMGFFGGIPISIVLRILIDLLPDPGP